MRNKTTRVIGWIGKESMTAEEAATAAITKCREMLGKAAGVLHLDTTSGRLTLLSDVDAQIPVGVFARGIQWNSDPDVLIYDLADEARELLAPVSRYAAERKERQEIVRAMVADGRSAKEIAFAVGKSESWAAGAVRDMGLKIDKSKEEARLAEAQGIVMDMLGKGASDYAAAKKAGVSTSTVWRWKKEGKAA